MCSIFEIFFRPADQLQQYTLFDIRVPKNGRSDRITKEFKQIRSFCKVTNVTYFWRFWNEFLVLVANEADACSNDDLFKSSVELGAGSGDALENSNDFCSITRFKGVYEITLQYDLDASGQNASRGRLRELLHKHNLLVIKGRVSIFHTHGISRFVSQGNRTCCGRFAGWNRSELILILIDVSFLCVVAKVCAVDQFWPCDADFWYYSLNSYHLVHEMRTNSAGSHQISP